MYKVSVIIPAHNEEERISECLSSVMHQTKKCEIIVVNDGSRDNTRRIVEEVIRKNQKPNIRLINLDTGHSAAYARNRGVEKARGKYLVFLDADNKLINKDFIEKLEKTYEKKKAGAVLWNSLAWETSFFSKIIGRVTIHPRKGDKPVVSLNKQDILDTIIFSYRRDIFFKLGKWDERTFYWEDSILTEKYAELGLPTYRILDNYMGIEPPNKLKDFLKQSLSMGRGATTIKDRKIRAKVISKITLKFFLFWILPIFSLFISFKAFLAIFLALLLVTIFRPKLKFTPYLIPFAFIYFLKVLYTFFGVLKGKK